MNAPASEISQRGLVLAAIVSLHILMFHVLTVGAGRSSIFDAPVLEADVLPAD